MTLRLLPLAVFGLLSSAAASCFVAGFDVIEALPSTSNGKGGGSATGGAGSGTGGMPCQHNVYPEQPAADDPGGSDVEFVAAMRSVDMGDAAPDLATAGPKVGYDLDGKCSCHGDGFACVEPAGVQDSTFCDGPGGIDNAGAKLFEYAQKFKSNISSQNFSAGAAAGDWTLLIRVKGYNGKPNDKTVTVSIYPSPGIHEESCVPKNQPPKWDGTDLWPIDVISLDKETGPGSDGGTGACGKGSVLGYSFDKPRYVDIKAFVAKGTLVANLPDSQIVISTSGVSTVIRLHAGFLTGQIFMGDHGYRLTKGIFTGRWKTTDMFGALSHLASGGMPLCTDNALYCPIKSAICSFRDITADVPGPTTACDSISLALGFETESAKLGIAWEGKPVMSPCGAKDPSLDTCDKKCPP